MAADLAKLRISLVAYTGGLKKGLGRAQGMVRRFAGSVKAQLAGLALGAGGVLGIGGIIKAASDMEETMSKFNVVFGKSAKAVKEWSDAYATGIGRSKEQTARFLAGTQDLFVPLGFAADKAEELSKQIVKLAVDLGSFNNVADDKVLIDLHAALTGSGEVMKKYGVLVNEAAVKQELLNQKLDPKVATNQQKVMARLNIIMAGTTAAQGDAARTAGGFANQMKALKAALSDAAVALGEKVLPVATKFVNWLSSAVKLIQANIDTIVKWIKWIAIVIVSIKAFRLAIQAAALAQVALLALSGPKGWAQIAIGLGVAAAATYTLKQGWDAVGDEVARATKEAKRFAQQQEKVAAKGVPKGPRALQAAGARAAGIEFFKKQERTAATQREMLAIQKQQLKELQTIKAEALKPGYNPQPIGIP